MGSGWKGRACWAVIKVARRVGGTEFSGDCEYQVHVRVKYGLTYLPNCGEIGALIV